MSKSVFAYGVVPTNPPETFENSQGDMETHCHDTEYLHFWVDADLQYGEEVRKDAAIPAGLTWSTRQGIRVELHGPGEYTIKSGRAQ
jgi:hypothetical protein